MELLAPAAHAVDDGHVLRVFALLGLDAAGPQHLLELEGGDDVGQLAVAVVSHPGGVELLVPGGDHHVADLELALHALSVPAAPGVDDRGEVADEALERHCFRFQQHLDTRVLDDRVVTSAVTMSRAESR